MPEIATTIHLSTLLGRLRTHKGKKTIAFYRAVIQRAALLAKNDAYRGRVELEDYPGWMFDLESAEERGDWSVVDRIDQTRLERGEEALDRTELKKAVLREFAAQEEMLDAVKDGKLDLIGWSRSGIYSCFDVDLSLLEQPKYETINRQFNRATNEISGEQGERRGYGRSAYLLWEDIVQEIIKKITVPCNETLLNYYADRVCLGDLPQSDSLTIAIADLHDRGFVEQWLRRIWQKYPNEVKEAELPREIHALCTQKEINTAVWKFLASVNNRSGLTSENIATGLGISKRGSMVRNSPAWNQYQEDQKKLKKARRVPSEAMAGRPDQSSDGQNVLDNLVVQEASEGMAGDPDQPSDSESKVNDMIEKRDWPGVLSAQKKEAHRQIDRSVPQPRQSRRK
ncbi:MAG: hypothetical protein IID41_09035 [Planctomycetes bacterium]|nr:hypothetical protein [Planctomycetota bacterium]